MRNKWFLKGTCLYIDEDLTIGQQEERRKEWERVKTIRENENWTWLQYGKVQISDKMENKK